MIGRLRGTVVASHSDGSCVLDVNGVGYELFVPLGALGRLAHAPDLVTLHVHTHVREDALTLYGFPTHEDRAAFRVLLTVSSVGPKIALAILSQMSVSELARAVTAQDAGAFKGISGVGKKIAERLVLELRDKLAFVAGAQDLTPASDNARPRKALEGPLGAVSNTLVQMGFRPVEADRAIALLAERAEGKSVEALLREALALLG